jgi:hypothetical protein
MKQDEHCTFVTENGMCPSHVTQLEDLQLFMLEDEKEAKQLKNRVTLKKGWMLYDYSINKCKHCGFKSEFNYCEQYIGDIYNSRGNDVKEKDIMVDADWPDIGDTILKTKRASEFTDPENPNWPQILVECTMISLKPEINSK